MNEMTRLSHCVFAFAIMLFLCACSSTNQFTEQMDSTAAVIKIQPTSTPTPEIPIASTATGQEQQESTSSQEATVVSFLMSSSSFEHKGQIPAKYTCKSDDISPNLQWKDIPTGTKSFALIVDDPDAPGGTWIHWVYYNIPASINQLPEDIKQDKQLSDGSRNGSNSWGKIGYKGPCPPSGTHRYLFKLYAIDTVLELGPGATKPELLKAIQGHTLGMAEIMGTVSK